MFAGGTSNPLRLLTTQAQQLQTSTPVNFTNNNTNNPNHMGRSYIVIQICITCIKKFLSKNVPLIFALMVAKYVLVIVSLLSEVYELNFIQVFLKFTWVFQMTRASQSLAVSSCLSSRCILIFLTSAQILVDKSEILFSVIHILNDEKY